MKTFHKLMIVLALLIPTAALAQTTSNQYKHIVTNWTPPAIGPAAVSIYPACNFTATPPVNTACVNGYSEVLTPPAGTNGTTATILPCSATLTSNCIPWGVSTYSWSPGGFLYVGTWNVSVSTAYLDANGVQQYAAPLLGSVVVPNPLNPPSPATGLNVTLAP